MVAAVVCLPLGMPVHATPADWAALAWLGVFQIGYAYLLLSTGVEHVTALEASLLLLAEPVLNPVWAWAVQGERPRRVGAQRGGADPDGDACADACAEPSQSALNCSQAVTIVSAAFAGCRLPRSPSRGHAPGLPRSARADRDPREGRRRAPPRGRTAPTPPSRPATRD